MIFNIRNLKWEKFVDHKSQMHANSKQKLARIHQWESHLILGANLFCVWPDRRKLALLPWRSVPALACHVWSVRFKPQYPNHPEMNHASGDSGQLLCTLNKRMRRGAVGILASGRLRQEVQEFKVILSFRQWVGSQPELYETVRK